MSRIGVSRSKVGMESTSFLGTAHDVWPTKSELSFFRHHGSRSIPSIMNHPAQSDAPVADPAPARQLPGGAGSRQS